MIRPAHLFSMMVLACSGLASAQTDASDDGDRLYQTLQSMQEEMEQLRKENRSMKARLDDLRAKTDADWLTQARADEIRGIVHDVLADADTRASLLQNGMMAGWHDRFFLADAFGRFLLQIDGMLQTRFVYNYRDQADDHRAGFEVSRTRLTFRGHVFNEDLQYLVRGEMTPHPPPNTAAGAFHLLDSWMRYSLSDEWSVRAGQFKLPFLREELVSEAEQLAVERSLVGENMTVGRSAGVEISYLDNVDSFAFALSNGMASRSPLIRFLMGGPHVNASAIGDNTEYAITARYERLLAGDWKQFDDFTSPPGEEFGSLLGIAMHMQQNESAVRAVVGANEAWSIGATADYSIEWGGASGFVAVTYHLLDIPTRFVSIDFGIAEISHIISVVGQFGVYVTPKLELFARGEWMQWGNAGGGTVAVPDFGIVTLGYNYYIEGHDIKWTSDVGVSVTELSVVSVSPITNWRDVSHGSEPEIVFRSQIQILF